MNNYPEGTTHVYTDTWNPNRVELYKEVGVSTEGNPTYVRWIKSRNNWATTPQAFDHVKNYATKI